MLFFLLHFIMLNTSFNVAYLYDSCSKDKLLPYKQRLTGKEVTDLFRSQSNQPAWHKTFFKARLDRLPENELLSFNAIEIASDTVEATDVQFGKGKEGGFQSHRRAILFFGHISTPVSNNRA